jgi:membrane protein DedA with SNARE-associated domain
MKNFEVSETLKSEILVNLVEPQYKKDIMRNLKLRKKFKNYGLFFETFSKFFVGVSSITSFSSGIYRYQILSFIAGTASVVSLVLLQYSSFSYRESKKLSLELNEILKKLNITTLNIEDMSNADSLENIEPASPMYKK